MFSSNYVVARDIICRLSALRYPANTLWYETRPCHHCAIWKMHSRKCHQKTTNISRFQRTLCSLCNRAGTARLSLLTEVTMFLQIVEGIVAPSVILLLSPLRCPFAILLLPLLWSCGIPETCYQLFPSSPYTVAWEKQAFSEVSECFLSFIAYRILQERPELVSSIPNALRTLLCRFILSIVVASPSCIPRFTSWRISFLIGSRESKKW